VTATPTKPRGLRDRVERAEHLRRRVFLLWAGRRRKMRPQVWIGLAGFGAFVTLIILIALEVSGHKIGWLRRLDKCSSGANAKSPTATGSEHNFACNLGAGLVVTIGALPRRVTSWMRMYADYPSRAV
jgi:hypothetical protein